MFKLLCLFCIGWQCTSTSGSPVTVTEYEYVRVADSWLRLHIVPASWTHAALICQLEGGLLASPTNTAIQEAMLDAMEQNKLSSDRVFIGVTDLLSKGEFKSLDGEWFPDLEWADSDEDSETMDCKALTDEGELAKVSCLQVLPYFCRKTAPKCIPDESPESSYYRYVTDDVNDGSGIPTGQQCNGNGYEWNSRTGSCYKFHRAAETWRSALSTCHAEGGHLAIINSRTESTVLKELYEQNNYTVITGTPNPYYASIGFRKWDDGEWATIHGKTLVEAGFEEWSPGEPNALGEENCGTMYWDGLLNDAPCDNLYPFICEKTLENLELNLFINEKNYRTINQLEP